MKKNIARISVLTVASLSLMLGGTSFNTSVKEQVSKTPVIISKAIENNIAESQKLAKGIAVKEVAQVINTEAELPAEEEVMPQEEEASVEEVAEVEEKAASVESSQVVANIDSYLNIREEASEDAEVVGKFYAGNVGTIVEKGEQWSLVSSGNAYGYVNNDYLLFGSDAEEYIENNCDQIAKVTAETLNVRAEESTDSDVITLADEGCAFTILGQEGDWIKVAASEEEVGFVARDFVYIDYVYETAVTIEEEEAAAQAEAEAEEAVQEQEEQQAEGTQQSEEPQQPADENTTEPVKEKPQEMIDSVDVEVSDGGSNSETVEQDSTSASGQAVADYAVQFVGNPYVYGGTSLTNGADCSGFVQSVYKHFGYSLPRVAASQADAGKSVKVNNLQPGDLLFYHGFGHVAIYIGGGQVVHASNAATGIKISNYDYSPIDKAVRIIY